MEKSNYVSEEHPQLWYFEWLDHAGPRDPGWADGDSYISPVPIISVGWALSEDEHSVYIGSHYCPENGDHQGGFCIVKSCIVNAVKMETPDAVYREGSKD